MQVYVVQALNEMAEALKRALPEDLLAQVLQLIDQKERRGSCSLVNSVWNHAVQRTSRSITCELDTLAQYQGLSSWLNNNNNNNISSITYIEVGSKSPQYKLPHVDDLPSMQLPYSNLSSLHTLELEAAICSLQFNQKWQKKLALVFVASSVPLSALTALTQLELDRCCFNLYELSGCSWLQHLDLNLISSESPDSRTPAADGSMRTIETVLAAALVPLQHLTSLSLKRRLQCNATGYHFNFGPIAAALSNLQHMQLSSSGQQILQSS